MVTIVVNDDQVDDVIEALITTNQTGKAGDGKIFVPAGGRQRSGTNRRNGDEINRITEFKEIHHGKST